MQIFNSALKIQTVNLQAFLQYMLCNMESLIQRSNAFRWVAR